ncbi:MAG: glycosyltransferase involved in cell wall biosynthesis [Candidatus Azotimanducaceae bacterium]|jgi:glycosyltransferase involved in cell wall biosynthesis
MRYFQSDLSHTLIPLMDVERAGLKWLSTGDDPHMSVAVNLPAPGWYEFEVMIDMEYQFQATRLYFDYGTGYEEDDSIALPLERKSMASRYFYLERIPEKVRFDPQTSEGIFDVLRLMIRPIAENFDIRKYLISRLINKHKRFQTLNADNTEKEILRLSQGSNSSWDQCASEFFNLTYVDSIGSASSYPRWLDMVESQHSLSIESSIKKGFYKQPLISILVPVYKPDPILFTKMIRSVFNQSYSNWQLCIVDDCSQNEELITIMEKWAKKDSRIVFKLRDENGHISVTSNDALAMADGAFCALLDHDDELHIHALSHVINAINHHPKAKIFYSDEDKLDISENRYDSHFKSDWNRDLLYSQNFVSHLGVYQKSLLDQVGGFRVGYEGSQDYDLLLRCIEHCEDKNIIHIPRILYHWRATEGSTALSSDQKDYTEDAGIRALRDHFNRLGHDVSVSNGLMPNTYRCAWNQAQISQDKAPLVSLLIPTRDGVELLEQCIESIIEKTTYPNYEILILDNQSEKPATHKYFERVKKDDRVQVIHYNFPFNFSGINNYGASFAKGEVIGLVNNDIEIISPNWLSEMVSHAIRPDIGCVGAKLYFENDAVQHGGVITGLGGVAGHSHKYADRKDAGYFCRLKLVQNMSAVTAAALLIRREVFLQVGGLDEALGVAFNDVDFCLKVDKAGYRNLWTPYAELYHYESVSRGSDERGEKKIRFDRETTYMKMKWGQRLLEDPYYNENLTKIHENFEIAGASERG